MQKSLICHSFGHPDKSSIKIWGWLKCREGDCWTWTPWWEVGVDFRQCQGFSATSKPPMSDDKTLHRIGYLPLTASGILASLDWYDLNFNICISIHNIINEVCEYMCESDTIWSFNLAGGFNPVTSQPCFTSNYSISYSSSVNVQVSFFCHPLEKT